MTTPLRFPRRDTNFPTMIADRPYMRRDSARFTLSATIILLIVNVVVFFIMLSNGYGSRFHATFLEYGALSLEGLKRGFVWQFLTFQFLHGGMTHLLLNSLGLFLFGRFIEQTVGRREFLKLYFLSGLAGGILQILLALMFPSRFGGPMVGASAGISGLVAAFAILSPHSTIYLFFFLPIRAGLFLPLIIILSTVMTILPTRDGIAHAAHLGGTLYAVAHLRWLRQGGDWLAGWWQRLLPRRRSRPIVKVRFPRSPNSTSERATPATSDDESIMREVDPILEKISAHGIQSLTGREREILEAARARMGKH